MTVLKGRVWCDACDIQGETHAVLHARGDVVVRKSARFKGKIEAVSLQVEPEAHVDAALHIHPGGGKAFSAKLKERLKRLFINKRAETGF